MIQPWDTTSLVAALRAARVSQGLSQTEIGRLVGCPQTQVSRWETGVNAPTLPYLAAYARAVGFELRIDLCLLPPE